MTKHLRHRDKGSAKNTKRKRKNPQDEDSSDDEILRSKKMRNENFQVKKPLKKLHDISAEPFDKCFWLGQPAVIPVSEELKLTRKSLGILVRGALHLCPSPVKSASDDGLPPIFEKFFSFLKYNSPTSVQMQCWPAILSGANVLGVAPTGSGKTLAYGIPLGPHILAQQRKKKESHIPSPIGLIIVPTRELAIQVTAALQPLKRLASIRTVAIYGGQDKDIQITSLQENGSVHVVVATPGRLLDLIQTKKLSLYSVSYLVIDEADRMFALGFEQQLDEIFMMIRPDKQAMLFSATFPGKLRDAATRYFYYIYISIYNI